MMKGKIGTPCTLTYARPYWDKCMTKLHHIEPLWKGLMVLYRPNIWIDSMKRPAYKRLMRCSMIVLLSIISIVLIGA